MSLPASLRAASRAAAMLLAVCSGLAVPARAAAPGAAIESRRSFDLPADAAERALKRLALQAGVDVVFAPEVTDGVRTNAVRGELTAREAAERLVAGTGLAVLQDEKTGVLSVARAQKSPAPPRATPAPAQKTTLHGRVFNPATGEYVQNAEITIPGTSLGTTSEEGGFYRLAGVPVGAVTVRVAYAGYQTASATVNVAAGETVVHDFELVSTEAKAAGDQPLKLTAFVVSSEREGNAKAIMEQRNSMTIGSIVASDVFGEVAEGNVGEFLKFMPGVELEYVSDDARTPRLLGMAAQHTGVTLDGMAAASADANMLNSGTDNTDPGQRSFGFDSISISSIDAVEVNYVTGADQDANAPAGTINLRTKRAFDRKGRRIAYSLRGAFNSREDSLSGFYGADGTRHSSFRPGGSVEYSDVFLDHRLGIAIGLNEYNTASLNSNQQLNYNNSPTASDPRPFVISAINMLTTRKLTQRETITFTTDYKISHRLSAGIAVVSNYYRAQVQSERQIYSGARGVNQGDGLTDFTITGNGSLALETVPADKITRSYTVTPRFEYNDGRLEIRSLSTVSHAKNHYDQHTTNAIVNDLTKLSYRAQRDSTSSAEWRITQLGGADWADLSNFKNPRIQLRDAQHQNDVYAMRLDAKLMLGTTWPTALKAGAKASETYTRLDVRGPALNYRYVGPGGGTAGSFADFPAAWMWTDYNGSTALSSSGGPAMNPNAFAVASAFAEHPEYFEQTTTASQWYSTMIANRAKVKETVNAAYGMTETKIGASLRVQAGLRWEGTRVTSSEYDQLPASAVRAAGFPVDSSNRPTTIEGYQYMFLSRPQLKRTGEYDNLFPSASINYQISPALIAQVGYNRTIARPRYADIAGAWDWDYSAETVTVPNPGLKPERGEKFMARLAWYFEPVGSLSIGAYQNNLTDAVSIAEGTAEEFGFGADPLYDDYVFYRKSNIPGTTRTLGYAVDYRQTLSFLPRPFGAMTVFANYSRAYASSGRIAGLPPHMISAGVDVRFGRFSLSPKFKWTAKTPWHTTASAGIVRKDSRQLDLEAEYRLRRYATLFIAARNVGDEPTAFYRENTPEKLFRFNTTGAFWTFGVKGAF